MIRKVTRIIVQPILLGNKWRIIVESRAYGNAPHHILEFDSKEEASRVCIGYEYSTNDIYDDQRKVKMNTLSVQQPFALLEVMGIKPIENRTWKTDFRGRIYVHACGWKRNSLNYQLTPDQKKAVSSYPIIESLLEEKQLMYSSIIGHVDLVDIVEGSNSMWALDNHYHWVLDNPVLFDSPIVNVKGNLNLWDSSKYLRY